MTIAALALDLDDTLVRSDQTISPRTLERLQAWADLGRHIVIATGRSPRATAEIPPMLHAFPWVCYNGGIVFDRRNGGPERKVLFRAEIPADDVATFLAEYTVRQPGSWVGLESNDRAFFVRGDLQTTPREDTVVVDDIRTVAHRAAAKIYLPLDRYRRVLDDMPPLPSHMRLLASEKYNLAQIMPAGVSKAAGLAVVAQHYGLDLQEFMAFGDDTNDLEMIQEAGVGVAMDNAIPQLKAVANRITLSNNDDGVAVVVEELLGL